VRTMHTRQSKALAYDPMMVPVEGRDGKQPASMLYPLRTMTTRSETGMAYPPFLAELRGGGSTARLASDPLATVTASGNHHGLVMPYYGNGQVTPAGRALPTVTTVDRHALIMRNNGGGAEMTTPATEPARTITTTGHQSLMTGRTVNVEDVHFRMLEPGEIKQAMAFPADYIMTGNRREQVKLSGNAVTPPAARDLIATVVGAITGETAVAA
jgi:DNA (cytosine-5)-methyltransferase 1